MKTLLLTLLILTPCAASNVLKPKGEAAPPMTWVEDGQARVAIILPQQPIPPARKAAEDLRYWVKQITGAGLPVETVPRAAAIVLKIDGDLAPEGYQISFDADVLTLAGGDGRGLINAVYALLEEDIGCRFYTNDSIKLPTTKTLAVSVVPRAVTPKLILRDPFYFASFDPTWSLRNRTNAPGAKVHQAHGGHIDYGPLFVHTHAALLPPDQYFKSHPEYFALNAAGERHTLQICPTDPNVVRIVTENVIKHLKQSPYTEIVSVSKNDNGEVCHCERCQTLRDAEGGSDMANQLFLVNQVAEALEKGYPNVLVDTLAYLETIKVPKAARPRKNVIIRICNDAVGAWTRPFTPARELPAAQTMKEWSAVHDRFSIWDYNVNFSHYPAPMPNMDVIADNIRFWVDNKAVGVMTQGGYQGTSERDELRSWVIAKLMWDPSLDANTLVEDFTFGHYGKAAPLLMEYEALLTALRKEHAAAFANPPGGIRYPMNAPFFTKAFLDKATDIFARAKTAAADDPALLRRVERAELPILYVKLAQGPIDEAQLEQFDRIARREKMDWILEASVTLDQQLDAWRKTLQ